jgi:uncharacterized membrane protein YfcA
MSLLWRKLPQEAIFMSLWMMGLCGAIAGAVNGLLGAGGGMLLVPLLEKYGDLEEKQIFPSSVAIILPICVVSLSVSAMQGPLPWSEALPYLFGCIPGGILAGIIGKKLRIKWLHRFLGVILLWGGIRYLW